MNTKLYSIKVQKIINDFHSKIIESNTNFYPLTEKLIFDDLDYTESEPVVKELIKNRDSLIKDFDFLFESLRKLKENEFKLLFEENKKLKSELNFALIKNLIECETIEFDDDKY